MTNAEVLKKSMTVGDCARFFCSKHRCSDCPGWAHGETDCREVLTAWMQREESDTSYEEMKKSEIRRAVEKLLSKSVSDDYASRIIDAIIEDVIEDVNETADPEEWDDDDVRLALGRVLLKSLGETV